MGPRGALRSAGRTCLRVKQLPPFNLADCVFQLMKGHEDGGQCSLEWEEALPAMKTGALRRYP